MKEPVSGEPCVLVIDVGTSVLKTSLIDSRGRAAGEETCRWSYRSLEGVPGGLYFDPADLLAALEGLLGRLLEPVNPGNLAGVITSAQRLGFIFLDGNNRPLFGIPNIDRRAAGLAGEFAGDEYAEYYRISGRWPGAQHLPARWRWLSRRMPGAGTAAAKVLSISDWLTFVLTGNMAGEATTACETGCLDIRSLRWSEEILRREDLRLSLFCELVPPGHPAGKTGAGGATLGLPRGIPVFTGAGDTQLGDFGAGAVTPGALAVVAGSSAPVNLVMDQPRMDDSFRTITNPYLFGSRWVMEANAMMTGLAFDWARGVLFGEEDDGYRRLEESAKGRLVSGRWGDVYAAAGPSIADARRGNMPKVGLLAFSMGEFNSGRADRGALALSVFESAAFAMASNALLLEEITGAGKFPVFSIGGGETKFTLLLDLLRVVLDRRLYRIASGDLSCLGAAMLAWIGLGRFSSPEEAVQAMSGKAEHPYPRWLEETGYPEEAQRRRLLWASLIKRFSLRSPLFEEEVEKGE